ncbi:prepilin peptidase [Pararhodobacter marinus]|uniref:Prepilin leader peptidase/N-methyltransferase n=1 Tax=Pararhodobacter marinus TaxID=2184063 RepID=A0A2U2C7E3_9RHOB|nr:A24 family peptidase [Pararhodobacter marinus]PWE27772.1 prepilin peptidase [Pararhodobacter marinus]
MGLMIVLGLLGAAMGSFAALVAERLVRGEPFVAARSHCRGCGTALAAADLVPLLSWPLLNGRCRHCGVKIPSVLWQAEILGAAMGVAAAWVAPDPLRALLLGLWMWSLLALAVADLRWFRLPEPLMAAAALLGLAVALAGDGYAWPPLAQRASTAILGAALGGGVFWAIREAYFRLTGREGMALGDVFLLAALGLALGAPRLPLVVLFAAGTTLALSLLRARRKGRAMRRLGRVPFGAALALSGVLVALLPGFV